MKGDCPHCHQHDIVQAPWYPRYAVSCPVCGFYIERGFGQTTVEEELKGQERFREFGRRAAGRLKRDDKGRFTEVAA